MKRLKPRKHSWRNHRGAVGFTELLAISALVGIGTLAGVKLLSDFNAELTDVSAAVRGSVVNSSSPEGPAPSECGGLSVAGTQDFALGNADDPPGIQGRAAASQASP
jgi:hypothetical protein